MANLNKVMLMGNLTRDPELRYTPKGTCIASFGLAVNRTWSNEHGEKQEETTFVDIEYFGRTAEVIGEHFSKGRPIFVEGRLKLDSWDDKATGQKRSKMKVIGEEFQFIGPRPDDRDDRRDDRPHHDQGRGESRREGNRQGGHRQPPRRPASPPPRPPLDPDLDGNADDDIPF